MKELIEIQSKLKAPKNQFNSFGKYNYRSCEDILEGVKPLLKEYNCILLLSDEPTMQGNFHYVVTHATLINSIIRIVFNNFIEPIPLPFLPERISDPQF